MRHSIGTPFADYDYKATAKLAAHEHSEHARMVKHIKKEEAELAKRGVNTTMMLSTLIQSGDPVVVEMLSRSQSQFLLPWRCPLHGAKLLNEAVRKRNHTHAITMELVSAIVLQVHARSVDSSPALM